MAAVLFQSGISLQLLSLTTEPLGSSMAAALSTGSQREPALEPASPGDALGSTTLLQPAGAFALPAVMPSTRIVRQLCGANCVCLPSMSQGCRRARTVGGEKRRPLFTDRTNRYTGEPGSTFVISRRFSVRPLPARGDRGDQERDQTRSQDRESGQGPAAWQAELGVGHRRP